MDPFTFSFGIVVGEEAGLTTDPRDKGNWTGGAVGRGVCKGTKYGISAASFPSVDIATLTLQAAQAIYKQFYWAKIAGDSLPAPLALLAFDAAVNNGLSNAVRWLQRAAGSPADGVLGAETLDAIKGADTDAMLIEFQAQRMIYMAALPTWRTYGLGWARRICGLPFKALPLFNA